METNRPRRTLKGLLALLPEPVHLQGITLTLQEVVEGKTVVAILLLDSRQPLSLRLFENIQKIQHPHFLSLIYNQRTDVPLPAQMSKYVLPGIGSAHHILGFHSCPGLAVVEVKTGRKISVSQEELGLLWNSTEDVTAAWVEEHSTCLKPWHRIQASLLFPTMCIIQ